MDDFAGAAGDFSGELGYEINVPADHVEGCSIAWGARAGVAAVPSNRSLEIMRTEKGFIHIAPTPTAPLCRKISFAAASSARQPISSAALAAPAAARDPNRFQLVALSPVDGRSLLPVAAIAAAVPPTQSEAM